MERDMWWIFCYKMAIQFYQQFMLDWVLDLVPRVLFFVATFFPFKSGLWGPICSRCFFLGWNLFVPKPCAPPKWTYTNRAQGLWGNLKGDPGDPMVASDPPTVLEDLAAERAVWGPRIPVACLSFECKDYSRIFTGFGGKLLSSDLCCAGIIAPKITTIQIGKRQSGG